MKPIRLFILAIVALFAFATPAAAAASAYSFIEEAEAEVEEQEQELGPTATVAVASTSAASTSFLKNKRELQGGSSYSSDTSSMSFMSYYGPGPETVSNSNMLIPSSLQIAEAAQHIIHCIYITVFHMLYMDHPNM